MSDRVSRAPLGQPTAMTPESNKHEGVRYTCNQCRQQFQQQHSLTAHVQSVHKGLKYVYNKCGKHFTQKGSLRTHTQSLHEGVK